MEFLVLLGPPGAGKGTLSRRLQALAGFQALSTGEVIRREMADPSSSFGPVARPYMDRGEYVPDSLAISLFSSILSPSPLDTRWCLDGFPRTPPQADWFRGACEEGGHRILGCVFLEITPEHAARRLRQRRVCRVCRAPYHLEARPPREPGRCDACHGNLIPREDDDAERLARRQEAYHLRTRPLLEALARTMPVWSVDGAVDPAAQAASVLRNLPPLP